MAGKSAALLTKVQRNRIRDDFDDLSEEKQRRDQQRIRERVKSGVFDFQLLADYPDRQFALTFDDTPDDELRAALADTTLVVERLRALHDIDRAALIDEARGRAETLSTATTGTETLTETELRPAAEIRRQTEADVKERLGTGPWDKRAERLGKLGASTFILLALIAGGNWFLFGAIKWPFVFLVMGLMVVLSVSLIGWLLIVAAQVLKYDVLPGLVALIREPEAAMRGAFEHLIRNPGETMRTVWDEL